jgi:Uma2 family endonuclease
VAIKTTDFSSTERVRVEAYYPESDGEPMGETDFHINAILYLRQALRHFFQDKAAIYVAANMFFYYEEGNADARRAPDVFVVKGVSKHDRRVYKLWEEKVGPCAVFEITSRHTRLEDLGTKRALYEMLGVPEYFLFDPLGEYLSPPLQGFRLLGRYYQPIEPSAESTLYSQELGVLLKPDAALLRVVDPQTQQVIPTLDEAVAQTQAAIDRAQVEADRAETEAKRAEAEAKRAEAEAKRAEAEADRADTAETEAARLRAEIEQLRRQLRENN